MTFKLITHAIQTFFRQTLPSLYCTLAHRSHWRWRVAGHGSDWIIVHCYKCHDFWPKQYPKGIPGDLKPDPTSLPDPKPKPTALIIAETYAELQAEIDEEFKKDPAP